MANSIKLDQKRLEHLRQSLYGKQHETPKNTISSKDTPASKSTMSHATTFSPSLGTESYIHKDLLKVAFLSTLAITIQFMIHMALVNKWIHINFYGITY